MRALCSRRSGLLAGLAVLGATSWIACGSSAESGATSTGAGSSSGSPAGSTAASSGNASSSGSSSVTTGAGGSSSSTTGSGAASASSSGGAVGVWHPGTSAPIHFHWFIGADFTAADILPNQDGQVVYDIDGEGATVADVAAIHAAGAIAVCYVDVGTLEMGRSDYSQFPASVIGGGVQGWPGENWLLVTQANQSIILPLMKARFVNWCQAKGFDGIEPDNLDAWTNNDTMDNPVPVTEADNLAYDLAIGGLAHALPLSIGLKNLMTDLDPSQYPTFLPAFDWALNESCFQYNECDAYTAAGSFLPAGKAVFDVEYPNASPDCTQADPEHMNAQLRDLDLVGPMDTGYVYTPCVPDAQSTW